MSEKRRNGCRWLAREIRLRRISEPRIGRHGGAVTRHGRRRRTQRTQTHSYGRKNNKKKKQYNETIILRECTQSSDSEQTRLRRNTTVAPTDRGMGKSEKKKGRRDGRKTTARLPRAPCRNSRHEHQLDPFWFDIGCTVCTGTRPPLSYPTIFSR